MGVNPIVILGSVLYFAVIFWIGWSSRKASLNASDYYVAGRKVGAFVNGSALAATYFSPASFLGLPAFIFIMGYPFWWALVGHRDVLAADADAGENLVGPGSGPQEHAAQHQRDKEPVARPGSLQGVQNGLVDLCEGEVGHIVYRVQGVEGSRGRKK